jgi:uncharacterized protein (DUF1330 family)
MVYMIIQVQVHDPELYGRYVDAVPAIVARYGGRYLVRGGEVTCLSEEWRPERVIVLEFPSRHDLERCFASPEYAAMAAWRDDSTTSSAIVVEGR